MLFTILQAEENQRSEHEDEKAFDCKYEWNEISQHITHKHGITESNLNFTECEISVVRTLLNYNDASF